jgi:hypothetical protein
MDWAWSLPFAFADVAEEYCEGHGCPARRFVRGDTNDDGEVDISDAVATLGVLFLGQGEVTCNDAADANDDGVVDISDAVATLGVLFLGQGEIPLPGMYACGPDPTLDGLTCVSSAACEEP